MQLSLTWEAASLTATEEFPNILWNLKEGSLPYSLEHSIGPYPKPYQSSPHHTNLLVYDPF
jgi:hypothetical protein